MKRIALPAPSVPFPRPNLDVRDLELVLALSAAGSTKEAASALHITQSAVSRALAQTEERVGTRLFERGARGLTPTPAGERLVAGAGVLLAELCELERHVAREDAPPVSIRLVCECYTGYRWLPSAMENLHRRLPGIEVDIAVEHTADPIIALEKKLVDVALLTTASVHKVRGGHGALVERPLFSDEVVFLVSTTHPLATARHLTRRDLQKHPLLTSNTPPAEARWFMSRVFGRHRPKLSFVRLPLTEAIVDAARAGMGIAVLSEWMAHGYVEAGGVVVKRLVTGPLRRPWKIAYRREVEGVAERLLGVLVGAAPRLEPARAGSGEDARP